MASFTFVLKEPQSNLKDKKKSKKYPTLIYLIIRDKGQRLKYSTQESINPNYWDFTNQKAVETLKFDGGKINGVLTTIRTNAESYIKNQKALTGSNPSLVQVREYLDSLHRVNKNTIENTNLNFLEYFQKYLDETSNRINPKTKKRISKNTIKTLRNTLTLLTGYNKTNRNTEKFESINLDWYYKFVEYLNSVKNYGTNTTGKHITNIKTVLRSATERGFNNNLAYMSNKFIGTRVDIDSIYLNESELKELYQLDLSDNKRLDRIRDLFIVGCYTGLRYSDVSKIRDINIQKEFITLKTQKTSTKVPIPYHPYVKEIIKKYKGKTPNSLPPSVSNTNMNIYIKEVCEKVKKLHKEVEVTKNKGGLEVITRQKKYALVSTHTMRRSFATNLYDAKIDIADIMSVTGHKTEAQFFKYIRREKVEGARNIQLYWNQKTMGKIS